MDMSWIRVEDVEPERGQKCFVKGLKGAYYAGKYGGRDIANMPIFWIPSGSFYIKADYYIPIID